MIQAGETIHSEGEETPATIYDDARPRLLDLYCGEGGAGMGYRRAGFEVTGVDVEARFARRYPGEFVCADAVEYVREHGHEYDAVHASPPCQRHSHATVAIDRSGYPDLIGPTREALAAVGVPWVIENVPRSPLNAAVRLSWPMFHVPGSVVDDDGTPLTMLRARWFEASFPLVAPTARPVPRGSQIAGCYGGARRDKDEARHVRKGGYVPSRMVQQRLMGIDWMTEHGMHEAIPPVYATWVGLQLRMHLLATGRIDECEASEVAA